MRSVFAFLISCASWHIANGVANVVQVGMNSMTYANFVDHTFHYLNVPKASETAIIGEFGDCAMKCLENRACVSINMAAISDERGKLWCELLASDKFNHSQSFTENATSHHFAMWSSCAAEPCGGGGTCVANYDGGTYKCLCRPDFYGNNCELACNVTDGWKSFQNFCYKLFDGQNDHSVAKQNCEQMASSLVTIHSKEETDFVLSMIPSNVEPYMWLNADDINVDGTWVWGDGKAWGEYQNWHSGEPNGGTSENCVEFYTSGGGNWNDASCSNSQDHFICKSPSKKIKP